MSRTIQVPHRWRPRPYQMPAWAAMERGRRRLAIVAHRRWGKDEIALHRTMVAAIERVGNYWHCLPEYSQGRKAIWTAVNPHTGRRRIDEAFPVELRKRTLEQEMFIEFVNGSTWQVIGSDTFDRLVGATPAGIVFSEFALANPAAWDYFRPMVTENDGWVIFISTVRGRNHFWKLAEMAKADPSWFYVNQTANDTDVFSREQLASERSELVALYGEEEGEARYRQEYLNDPAAALPGSYYGKYISALEERGAVRSVPWDVAYPVTTGWDLGIGDSTAIWWAQQVGRELRVIDYYEASGVGLEHYVKVVREKPYIYADHLLPHDADAAELGSGKTRRETLSDLGLRVSVLPRAPVDDRINAVRQFLPIAVFDERATKRGLDALRSYQREWDEKLHDFKSRPRHDWTSHGADAFGYLCQGIRPATGTSRPRSRQAGNARPF